MPAGATDQPNKATADLNVLLAELQSIVNDVSATTQQLLGVLSRSEDLIDNSVELTDKLNNHWLLGAIDTIESIKNLLVSTSSDGKITYLSDIANIYRGYKTPTQQIIRYDGKFAIALAVSSASGGNVVEIGEAVDQKIRDAESRRPLGMDVSTYYNQGEVVKASVDNFVINVLAALVIVIVTLFNLKTE